jgi:glycosyltransferase involved in cell wall biosynthesis
LLKKWSRRTLHSGIDDLAVRKILSMRNVLAVINTPTYGGPHNQLLRLSAPLELLGWRYIAVLPVEGGDDGADRLRAGGVEVIQIPLHRLRALWAIQPQLDLVRGFRSEVKNIRGLIRSQNIAVVQVCGTVNVQPALAARYEGVGLVWQLLSNFAPLPLRALMSPMIAGMSDVVMTTGTHTARQHPGVLSFSHKVMPFLPPVDTDKFKPGLEARKKARVALGVPEDAWLIGTVGNFNRQKAHERLIEAAPDILARIHNSYIRVLGTVTPAQQVYYESEVIGLARKMDLLSNGRVAFESPGQRVAELLPAFDAFVLTSRSEGIPTAMLEAMSAGVPVVVPAVGSIPEVIIPDWNGVLLKDTKPSTLVDALSHVASDSGFAETIAHNARSTALERFSLDACAKVHVSAFAEALQSDGGFRVCSVRQNDA